MTNVGSFSPLLEDTHASYRFLLALAEPLDQLADELDRLPPEVQSEAFRENDVELWAGRPGWIDIVHFENKRRDEMVITFPDNAIPADLSAALRDSGWGIALLALLAIDDAVIRPREIGRLIDVASDGLRDAIEEQTRRRLTR